MQVNWCLKFLIMTKSGGTIPPLQILGGGTCPPLPPVIYAHEYSTITIRILFTVGHRRSQGVHWVHGYPQGENKNLGGLI